MFKNYISSGKHMICDFKGISNYNLLNNCIELNGMLEKICVNYNFQILGKQEHQFVPIGCSIIFLLSESHISIHTFPEKNHMAFDIYTCRQYKNNDEYLEIYNLLINELQASHDSKYTIINRYF
jgi:S-adenosylmethionine decarboxylase proenzyme